MSDYGKLGLGVTVAPLHQWALDFELLCEVCEQHGPIYEVIRNEPEGDSMLTCGIHLNRAVQKIGGYEWG